MLKSPQAFRTISEVAETLDVPPHVLRFWETRFAQVKPVKRGGGRRYYRPEDVRLLRGIRGLLYDDGMTIKGVQKILRERGVRHVIGLGTVDDADELAAARTRTVTIEETGEFDLEDSDMQDADLSIGDTGEIEAGGAVNGNARDMAPSDGRSSGSAHPASGTSAAGGASQTEVFPVASNRTPAGDRSALRDLIRQLEILRGVMSEGRG